MSNEAEEKLAHLQAICQRALHVIGHLGGADVAIVLAQTDPEHLAFHCLGESGDQVLELVVEAACTFARMNSETQEEAFDKLTSLVMTKFNDIKDYELTENSDGRPAAH